MNWEYKVIKLGNRSWFRFKIDQLEPTMNDLGVDGWECISVESIAVYGTTHELIVTFKRAKN